MSERLTDEDIERLIIEPMDTFAAFVGRVAKARPVAIRAALEELRSRRRWPEMWALREQEEVDEMTARRQVEADAEDPQVP